MNITVQGFVEKYHPCAEGAAFARKYATMHDVWNALANGKGDPSWLIWLASRDGIVDRKVLVRATCKAVRTTPVGDKTLWKALTDERSRNAIVVAEQWVDGRATLDDVRKAAYTAYTAANAAAATAYAADAADAAADAADAAAYAAANAANAADATRQAHLARCAQLVRELMPQPPG